MIGLLENSLPITGGISLPYFSEIYFAERHKGSYCNNKRIFVTNENRIINTLIAYGIDGHQDNPEITKNECAILANIILRIRNLRSSNSAFDACMVAEGKYGGFLNNTSKIWDNVAQQIIIEESGGIYTDFYGHSIDYSNPLEKSKNNFTWCAGSPTIHKKLQNIIKLSR